MSYETFWHLNPKKLEPFVQKKELELKEQTEMLNVLAWNTGYHVLLAVAQIFGENHPKYPSSPQSVTGGTAPEKKGEVMTDGAKFAAFAIEHNKQARERRKKKSR